MNSDPFEEFLKNQQPRQLPPEWRNQILAAARAVRPESRESKAGPASFLSRLNYRLSTLLWPSPAAWAGVTAVWLVIAGLNLAARQDATPITKRPPRASAQVLVLVREQNRLVSEILGPADQPVPVQPKPPTVRPRSERSSGRSFT